MANLACEYWLGPLGLAANAQCLETKSIKQCQHLLECSPTDLMELGNLTHDQALLAQQAATAALAPQLIPLQDLWSLEYSKPRLATGLSVIDGALGGGLLNASITELVGPSGAALLL